MFLCLFLLYLFFYTPFFSSYSSCFSVTIFALLVFTLSSCYPLSHPSRSPSPSSQIPSAIIANESDSPFSPFDLWKLGTPRGDEDWLRGSLESFDVEKWEHWVRIMSGFVVGLVSTFWGTRQRVNHQSGKSDGKKKKSNNATHGIRSSTVHVDACLGLSLVTDGKTWWI